MASIKITRENFEKEVLKSPVPVMVDFWAPWCGPCKMISPIIEELSDEVSETAKVCKVNVDEEFSLAKAFGIMSIPTILVFKDGKVAGKAVGARDKAALKNLLKV